MQKQSQVIQGSGFSFSFGIHDEKNDFFPMNVSLEVLCQSLLVTSLQGNSENSMIFAGKSEHQIIPQQDQSQARPKQLKQGSLQNSSLNIMIKNDLMLGKTDRPENFDFGQSHFGRNNDSISKSYQSGLDLDLQNISALNFIAQSQISVKNSKQNRFWESAQFQPWKSRKQETPKSDSDQLILPWYNEISKDSSSQWRSVNQVIQQSIIFAQKIDGNLNEPSSEWSYNEKQHGLTNINERTNEVMRNVSFSRDIDWDQRLIKQYEQEQVQSDQLLQSKIEFIWPRKHFLVNFWIPPSKNKMEQGFGRTNNISKNSSKQFVKNIRNGFQNLLKAISEPFLAQAYQNSQLNQNILTNSLVPISGRINQLDQNLSLQIKQLIGYLLAYLNSLDGEYNTFEFRVMKVVGIYAIKYFIPEKIKSKYGFNLFPLNLIKHVEQFKRELKGFAYKCKHHISPSSKLQTLQTSEEKMQILNQLELLETFISSYQDQPTLSHSFE